MSLPNTTPLLALLVLAACGTNDAKSTAPGEPAKTAADPKSEAPPAKPAPSQPELTDPKSVDAKPAAADTSKPAPKADAEKTDKPASTDPVENLRAFIASKKIDKSDKTWKTKVPMPPKQTFDPKKTYYWLLNTTEGPIKIRLMTDVAPMHVSSTIYLTELGFYDDILFHRVIPGFMAQGGDPLGAGYGGPAYKYAGEFSKAASNSKPGILSMANAGPNTDGSQFFLLFTPQQRLDGKHTVFGETVEGLDNLKKFERFGSESGATSKVLKIETAKIVVE